MDILQHLSTILATAGMLFSSFLGHSLPINSQQAITPPVAAQDTTSSSNYIISRALTYDNFTVNMFVSVPKNGGNITGKISGDCNGNIIGTYDGKDNGAVNGNANVSCQLLAVQIPGTATFTGTINTENKTAQLQVTMKVNSFEKTQNVNVTFK